MQKPKIERREVVLDGKKVTITIVRDSKICRWFSKKNVIVVGHTIYCAGWFVSLKEMFQVATTLRYKRSLLDKMVGLLYF